MSLILGSNNSRGWCTCSTSCYKWSHRTSNVIQTWSSIFGIFEAMINTMCSTEIKPVAIFDGIPKNIWCLYFTEALEKNIKNNLLNKDNTSRIELAKNKNRSTGKMKKQEEEEVTMIHCSTKS